MAHASNTVSNTWFTAAIAAPLHAILAWYRISQERRELRSLSSDRLSDVGITQREVEWETSRPFWQSNRGG